MEEQELYIWRSACLALMTELEDQDKRMADMYRKIECMTEMIDHLLVEMSSLHISEEKEKWIFYHQNKKDIRDVLKAEGVSESDLVGSNGWRRIKARSDQIRVGQPHLHHHRPHTLPPSSGHQ